MMPPWKGRVELSSVMGVLVGQPMRQNGRQPRISGRSRRRDGAPSRLKPGRPTLFDGPSDAWTNGYEPVIHGWPPSCA